MRALVGVGRLEAAIGHAFQDRGLLERALTHRSAGAAHNERLEFLGDAMLGYLVARRLFEAFPEAPEKDLTLMRAGLVRRESLAKVARDIGLGKHLLLGAGERRSGVRDRDSVLEDGLEALLGAVVLDGGVDAAAAAVDVLFEERIAALDGVPQQDAKTRLQELTQARGMAPPEYLVEVAGEAHAPRFVARCRVPALDVEATGAADARRAAEQEAARGVLERLM